MQLLFLSNVFPNANFPTKGTFNYSLLRAMSREHRVHVVSPVSYIDEFASCVRNGGNAKRSELPLNENLTVEYPRFYYTPKLLRQHFGRFMWWSIRGALMERMREFRPDAVLSYWAHPDGEAAVLAAREAGVPAVVMVGGSDVLLLARNGSRRRAILQVLHDADAVVAVSQDIANHLMDDGIAAEKIHVIYRGVERDVFSPGDRDAARTRLGVENGKHVLVAVGRLVPVKGFDLLVSACRELVRKNVPVACYILGSGPLEGALSRQIADFGLSDNVFLAGAKPQATLADWYRAADLTVLTSHSEGVPNVLLESISCGTPFVATNVGGVAEIADERCHTLVPPNDASAIATAIAQRLSQHDTTGASPRLCPLTWEESAAKLCDIIQTCGGPS